MRNDFSSRKLDHLKGTHKKAKLGKCAKISWRVEPGQLQEQAAENRLFILEIKSILGRNAKKWLSRIQMSFQINIRFVYNLKQQGVEFYRIMSQEELSQSQELEVAGFVAKTFQILNNQEYSKIIFWGPSGKDFVIKDINKFQEIVLPRYFRHRKINSFIRQLNMYGFHKSRKDNAKSIFSHPQFLKDREDLLSSIRRKIKSSQSSIRTPIKEKSFTPEKKVQQTAVKQGSSSRKYLHQQSQVHLRGFFESQQYINSILNLNFSLKKISMQELGQHEKYCPKISDDDKISIQLQIQNRDQDFKQSHKIINPSFFINSWKESHPVSK